MRIIDLEHHFYTQHFLDAASGRQDPPSYDPETKAVCYTKGIWMPLGKGPLLDALLDLSEKRIALMDAAGIDTAVLECSPGAEEIPGEEGIRLCRDINQTVFELTQIYPGRFLGAAVLPVFEPEAAVKELEHCVRDYGFVIWHTHSNYGNAWPDDEAFRPILKKAAELGTPVYIHPSMPDNPRINSLGVVMSAAGLGFTLDTMTTISAFMSRGVLDEIPGLKLICGHFGEALPFLMERMDSFLGFIGVEPLRTNQQVPSYYFRNNIWVTTSGNYLKEAFTLTKNVLGIDHILVGTDHPYGPMKKETDFLAGLDLTDEEREKLYYKNAESLLKPGKRI